MIYSRFIGPKHLTGGWVSEKGIICKVKGSKLSLSKDDYDLFYHHNENNLVANLTLNYRGLAIINLNSSQEDHPANHPDLREILAHLGSRQIMGIAAGLGEFIPFVSKKTAVKPLVIESLAYDVITELLDYAAPLFLKHHREDAAKLSENCRVMMDQDKVQIIGSLQDVLGSPKLSEQLFGTVDVLIDNLNFPNTIVAQTDGIREETLRDLELRLLKENGIRYGLPTEKPLVKMKGRFVVLER